MRPQGFLKVVMEEKKSEVTETRRKTPLTSLREEAEHQERSAPMLAALKKSSSAGAGIIAEIKKASPSRGDIRPDLSVSQFAEIYTRGGAAAISVLTEKKYFKGSLEDLKTVCSHSPLPVLRKDFILSSFQIFEARAAGADAVLLITAMLSPNQLNEYVALAREINLEPLVEIHSEWEFETAAISGAALIGVNNRNLQTLETDLSVSERLAPFFTKEQVPVEASGIASPRDIRRGLDHGYLNFLVGGSIVEAEEPAEFIRELVRAGDDHAG